MRAALLAPFCAVLVFGPSALAATDAQPVPDVLSAGDAPPPPPDEAEADAPLASTSGPSASSPGARGSGAIAAPPRDGLFGEQISLFVVGVAFASLGAMAVSLRRGGRARTAQAKPGVPGILVLGQQAVDRGDIDGALQWFDAALKLQPGLSVAHVCRGLCLRALGYEIDALESFRDAALAAPSDPLARLQCARSLYALSRNDAAIAEVAKVVELAPEAADLILGEFTDMRDHPMFLRALGKL